jgi:hypothetical protein
MKKCGVAQHYFYRLGFGNEEAEKYRHYRKREKMKRARCREASSAKKIASAWLSALCIHAVRHGEGA